MSWLDNIASDFAKESTIDLDIKKKAYQTIDPTQLQTAFKQSALDQSQQQLAQTNALISSQKGINPALATMQMGNLQSNAAQNIAMQTALGEANIGMQAQESNIRNAQTLYGIEKNVDVAKMQDATNRNSQWMQMFGAGLGALGGIASIFSDERLKEAPSKHERIASGFFKHHTDKDASEDFHSLFDDVEGYTKREKLPEIGPNSKEMQSFLNSLDPVKFSYKEGSIADDGAKTHAGVLAQDVEKTSLGKDIVTEQDGYKALDMPSLLSALTAGVGHINQRLNQLEGSKNG